MVMITSLDSVSLKSFIPTSLVILTLWKSKATILPFMFTVAMVEATYDEKNVCCVLSDVTIFNVGRKIITWTIFLFQEPI